MKTLQEQYNLIKKGKGHKDVFLKEAKSRYPHMISNVLTYDQVITILKQRSVINEHTFRSTFKRPTSLLINKL